MTLIEKNLYSQIHPLRLFTDWVTGLYACYLLWYQELIPAMITAFIPSLIVSLVIVRFVNLEKVKNSPFGRYFKRTYNRTIDLTRFGGFVIMACASWMQFLPAVAVGLAVIIGTWTYGLFAKK
ncbi:MAG: hypothetical protein ACOYNS_09175 [Bacteroidota bacterium]